MVKEYLDHYKMDYTKSVYIPEIALDHTKDFQENVSRSEFARRAGVVENQEEAVIVTMMK